MAIAPVLHTEVRRFEFYTEYHLWASSKSGKAGALKPSVKSTVSSVNHFVFPTTDTPFGGSNPLSPTIFAISMIKFIEPLIIYSDDLLGLVVRTLPRWGGDAGANLAAISELIYTSVL